MGKKGKQTKGNKGMLFGPIVLKCTVSILLKTALVTKNIGEIFNVNM